MSKNSAASTLLAGCPADLIRCLTVAYRMQSVEAGELDMCERLAGLAAKGDRQAEALMSVGLMLQAPPQSMYFEGSTLIPEKMGEAAKRLMDNAIARAHQALGMPILQVASRVLRGAGLISQSEQDKILWLARQPIPAAA